MNRRKRKKRRSSAEIPSDEEQPQVHVPTRDVSSCCSFVRNSKSTSHTHAAPQCMRFPSLTIRLHLHYQNSSTFLNTPGHLVHTATQPLLQLQQQAKSMCVHNKCAHLLDAGLSCAGTAYGQVKLSRRRHAASDVSGSAGRGSDRFRAEAKLASTWLPTRCPAKFARLA